MCIDEKQPSLFLLLKFSRVFFLYINTAGIEVIVNIRHVTDCSYSPPRNERIGDTQHLQSRFGQLHEHAVVDLAQAEELQNLLHFWTYLVNTAQNAIELIPKRVWKNDFTCQKSHRRAGIVGLGREKFSICPNLFPSWKRELQLKIMELSFQYRGVKITTCLNISGTFARFFQNRAPIWGSCPPASYVYEKSIGQEQQYEQ